jgi:hypothetical protein
VGALRRVRRGLLAGCNHRIARHRGPLLLPAATSDALSRSGYRPGRRYLVGTVIGLLTPVFEAALPEGESREQELVENNGKHRSPNSPCFLATANTGKQ